MLDLSTSQFVGPIPTGIGALTQLTRLALNYNLGLNGTLPSSLGNLTGLQFLDISYTALVGTLPDSLSNLRQLRWVCLDRAGLRNLFLSR